jgi:pimeloyl-ACP methyl ester carboxylesterase
VEEFEHEIHAAVTGSQYPTFWKAGHFPMAEQPEAVNQAIKAFMDALQVS